MAPNQPNPAFLEPNGKKAQPELLVSAVLHLMSHYTANAGASGSCVKLASVIERHLKALAELDELAPVLRATCSQLSEQWATVVENTLPQPRRAGLLERFCRVGTGSSCPRGERPGDPRGHGEPVPTLPGAGDAGSAWAR